MKQISQAILLLLIIFSCLSSESQERVDYKYQINKGTEVLAITNREYNINNGKYIFQNLVDTISPLSFFHTKHIADNNIRLEKLTFKKLEKFISSKEGNWLLFVHGDFKTFELSVLRAMDISETYGINVMVFCWPSKDPKLSGTKNFKNSKSNVYKSKNDFLELLDLLNKLNGDNVLMSDSISAFFHSLGNLYLQSYAEGSNAREKIFSNLIINSAAVEEEDHNIWVDKLNLQKRLYILFNEKDFTLNGLRIFTPAGKQLGERIRDTLSTKAIYLDFSESIGNEFPTWNSHSYYIGDIPSQNKIVMEIYWQLYNSKFIDLGNGLLCEATESPNRYVVK